MKTSKKSGQKIILILIISVVLLCTMIAALFMNGNIKFTVNPNGNAGEEAVSSESEGEGEEKPVATEGVSEETQQSDEDPAASAHETECVCDDKCGMYGFNEDCAICVADYRACTYVYPNVSIRISTPIGWYSRSVQIMVEAEDVASSGNFELAKAEAKSGENGAWTDITDAMYIEITEDCTVYVRITDQHGRIYEDSNAIQCFDFTKPTLNAAVNDGVLTIQACDLESGVGSIFVNGYKYTELDNGLLTIRLEKFDAGYEDFLIYAQDNAGNTSENYRTKNPYYKDPADESDENPAEQLPTSAKPTDPGSAVATVTEHTVIDASGNEVTPTDSEQQRQEPENEEDSERGKEFYTIQTASEKVFYLIIDRNGDKEVVYFLTEITENDLLNVTSNNSETLPKNSAALDNGIPVTDNALPNNNTGTQTKPGQGGGATETGNRGDSGNLTDGETPDEAGDTPEKQPAKENSMAGYIVMGIFAVIGIGGGYYFKVVRKKKDGFLDEEDDEDDGEEEEFVADDDEEISEDDDFFRQDESDATETIDEE